MVTPQLLDYIRKQHSAGISNDTINANLQKNKWLVEDIQIAFNQLGLTINPPDFKPAQSNELNVKKKQFPWLIVIVSVIIISIISIIVITKVTQASQYGIVNNKAVLNNSFYTYTSKIGNFSIQYPQNWPLTKVPADCDICVERFAFAPQFDVFKQDPNNGYIPPNAYAYINILKVRVYKTFDQKNVSLKGYLDIKYLSINGERAISYAIPDSQNVDKPRVLRIYWVLHNSNEYNFSVFASGDSNIDNERLRIFDSILQNINFQN